MRLFFIGLWKLMADKGKIATIIGFCLSSPFNIWALWSFFSGSGATEDQLWTIAIINGIAMIWFILPSKILIEGKGVKIEVTD